MKRGQIAGMLHEKATCAGGSMKIVMETNMGADYTGNRWARGMD